MSKGNHLVFTITTTDNRVKFKPKPEKDRKDPSLNVILGKSSPM